MVVLRFKGIMAIGLGKVCMGKGNILAPFALPIDQYQGADMSLELLGCTLVEGPDADNILHPSIKLIYI